MTDILLGLLCLSMFMVFVALWRLSKQKPIQIHEKIVPAISQFDPKAPVTTVCPAPFGAQSCSHDWDVVVKEVLELPHEKKLVTVLKCDKCGSIDKTMAVTSTPPPTPAQISKADCRHRWVKEKIITLKSAFEQMTAANKFSGTTDPWVFRKTHVAIRVCSSCGTIDKTVVSNFEEGKDVSESDDKGSS